jgi:hypothetical protein
MTPTHRAQLDAEVKRLVEYGAERLSVKEYTRRWNAAGFRFDHSCTIRQFARYVSGPFAGESWPEMTLYPVHKTTGLSAYHFQLPESECAKVKALRLSIFAVSRDGYILAI